MEKKSKSNSPLPFPGFREEIDDNYFKYPLELERYWHILSGSEAKVLTYILRALIGFQKTEDYISLSQIQNGAGRTNNGTGLSIRQIRSCLVSLEEKGFIFVRREYRETNYIMLKIDETGSALFETEEDVRFLAKQFAVVDKDWRKFLKNKREVKALRNLLEVYGEAKVVAMIALLPKTNTHPYAPKARTPYELNQKFMRLYYYLAKEENYRKSNQIHVK